MEITFKQKQLILDSFSERVRKIDRLLPIFADDQWMTEQYQGERDALFDLCKSLTGYDVNVYELG